MRHSSQILSQGLFHSLQLQCRRPTPGVVQIALITLIWLCCAVPVQTDKQAQEWRYVLIFFTSSQLANAHWLATVQYSRAACDTNSDLQLDVDRWELSTKMIVHPVIYYRPRLCFCALWRVLGRLFGFLWHPFYRILHYKRLSCVCHAALLQLAAILRLLSSYGCYIAGHCQLIRPWPLQVGKLLWGRLDVRFWPLVQSFCLYNYARNVFMECLWKHFCLLVFDG